MKKILAVIILALICLFSSCSETPEPSPEPFPPVIKPAITPPESPPPSPDTDAPDVPSGINPLTGLPIDEKYAARRPVVVMMNNLKKALPQVGISKADQVYEIVAEGGITRLVAVFQDPSQAGDIGSVRSTRHYYLDIAQGLDGVLVHAGGSPQAYEQIPLRGVTSVDGVKGAFDRYFWRDPVRRKRAGMEHSLLTSGEKLTEAFNSGSFRSDHREGYIYPVVFSSFDSLRGGTDAKSITVKHSPVKTGLFEYDAAALRYKVFQNGDRHIDGTEDVQLEFENVFVLESDVSRIKGDTEGRMNVRMTGSGRGIYACLGKMIPIEWTKQAQESPFEYRRTDTGEALSLLKGKSYIAIISDYENISIKN